MTDLKDPCSAEEVSECPFRPIAAPLDGVSGVLDWCMRCGALRMENEVAWPAGAYAE